MLIISHYSRINSPVEAQANKALTGAVIEYARGLAVVKSFGKDGAAMATVTKAIDDSRKIHQKIEWAMFPATLCICWLVFMTRSKAIFPSADIICGNLPAAICLEGVDSIGAALKELGTHGYIRRTRLRDEKGKIADTEYVI